MNLGISAASGLITILPFAVMELINRSQENFPFLLFGFLWILAAAFILILMPLLGEKTDKKIYSPAFFVRGIFLIFIAFIWISVVIDQMPCFLGLPNCD